MPRGDKTQAYWDRVQRLEDIYGLSRAEARAFIKHGSFREVQEEGFRAFQKRYRVRFDDHRQPHYIRTERGIETEVSGRTIKTALSRSFYEAMVKRLQVWTGFDYGEVREYLAQYENWRDGISPLFHEAG